MDTITVSFSLDASTKAAIDEIAKAENKSPSDVVRDVFAKCRLDQTIQELEKIAAPKLKQLGLETEEDIAAYFKHQ